MYMYVCTYTHTSTMRYSHIEVICGLLMHAKSVYRILECADQLADLTSVLLATFLHEFVKSCISLQIHVYMYMYLEIIHVFFSSLLSL